MISRLLDFNHQIPGIQTLTIHTITNKYPL